MSVPYHTVYFQFDLYQLQINVCKNLVWKNIKFLPFVIFVYELLEEISKNVKSKEDSACSHNVAINL
jgi:hypothetical protein